MTEQNKKDEKQYLKTPIAVAYYPKLNKYDEYQGARSYIVRLAFKKDDAEWLELKDTIDKALNENYVLVNNGTHENVTTPPKYKGKCKMNFPYDSMYDEEGNETDYVLVKFKRNAFYKDKETNEEIPMPPALFDSQLNRLDPTKTYITHKSRIRVNYFMKPYLMKDDFGISLKLSSVQLIYQEPFKNSNFNGSGFDTVEGGYVANA